MSESYTEAIVGYSARLESELKATVAQLAEKDKEIAMLRGQLKRVVGWHNAPGDCYSTGPLHSDYRDAMCPSCEAETMLKNTVAPPYVHKDTVTPLVAALEEAIQWDSHDSEGIEAVWLKQARNALDQYEKLTGEK